MKRLTALALVAGLSATGASAQPYNLIYDASTGNLSVELFGSIINYTLESTDSIFLEDDDLLTAPTNWTPFVSFFYVDFDGPGPQAPTPVGNVGTRSATSKVLGESNNSYNGVTSGVISLGNILPAGLSEAQFQAVADKESTYVVAQSTPKQNWNLVYVPEPTSLALLSLGGLLVARRRRSA